MEKYQTMFPEIHPGQHEAVPAYLVPERTLPGCRGKECLSNNANNVIKNNPCHLSIFYGLGCVHTRTNFVKHDPSRIIKSL